MRKSARACQKRWAPRKRTLVDLVGDDAHAHEVALAHTEPHLLENEVRLLALLHAAESLDLHLLQRLRRLGDLALALLDQAQHARHARALDLDEDVRARHRLERRDELEPVGAARQLLDEADARDHHVLDSLPVVRTADSGE